MYFHQQDPQSTILFVNQRRRGVIRQPPTKYARKIHLKFDLSRYYKNSYSKISQDRLLASELNRLETILKDAKNITELIVELDLSDFEDMKYYTSFKQFISDYIITKHKDTIEKVTFQNCNLQYLLSQESDTDLIEELLLFFITPLPNLKSLGFVDKLLQKSISADSVCQAFQKLMKNKVDLFKQIESLKVGFAYEYNCITTKNMKQYQDPALFNFIHSLLQSLSQIKSLTTLDVEIKDVGFDSNQFSKLNNEILKCDNLKTLMLDFNQEKECNDISVDTIKVFKKLNKSLEKFEYNFFPQAEQNLQQTKALTCELSKLKNLQQISLQRLGLDSEGLEELFKCLSKFPELTSIALDLNAVNTKSNGYQPSFEQLCKGKFSLKSFDVVCPYSQSNLVFSTPALEFLNKHKETLEFLKISFKHGVAKESLLEIFNELENFRNLNYFGMFFYKDNEIENRMVISSSEQNAQNIFKLKKLVMDDDYWSIKYFFMNQLAISYILKYQDINCLEEIDLKYSDYNVHNKNRYEEQYNQNLESLQNFKNLKVLNLNFIDRAKLLNSARLIEVCQESLLHLKCYNQATIDELKSIYQCKQLISLKVVNSNNTKINLQELCENLSNLQSLDLSNKPLYYYSDNPTPLDCSGLFSSDFITNIDITSAHRKNDAFISLIKQRYRAILQQITIFKSISPFLIFKPKQCHWDLYLDSI